MPRPLPRPTYKVCALRITDSHSFSGHYCGVWFIFVESNILINIHTCVRDVKFCIVLCARDSRIVKFLFFITLSSSFDYLENRMARVSDMCSV